MASYAWGGKAIEKVAEMIPNIKAELLEPVLVKGYPKADDLVAIERLANEIFTKHSNNKLQP